MTEQEAVRYGEEYLHDLFCAACKVEDKHKDFVRMSIKALEEIQQYRAIGLTPEQIEAMQGHNTALIEELAEYQAIGTVEECREAVEKQTEIRNKAIDDFKDAIVQKFTEYDKKGYVDHTNAGIKSKVTEIAEQLKVGVEE
ncbi:MAG: hypothetical protein ACI4ES_12200 [Roseburia sp.]